MPIYEYQCRHCGCKFEALQKLSDQSLTKCPECGKDTLEKCVSLARFRLKGKGWYETDFKGKKPSQEKEKAAESKAGADKTTEGSGSRDSSGQQVKSQDRLQTGSRKHDGKSDKKETTS